MFRKFNSLYLALLVVLLFGVTAYAADAWDYGITDVDTPTYVDASQTSAQIDTILKEITLPQAKMPDIVKLASNGSNEYTALTDTGLETYTFDGTQMARNTTLDMSLQNPLALAHPTPYPTMAIAQGSEIKQYKFNGSNMVEVPALAVTGLTEIVSISSVDNETVAALTNGQVRTFQWDGTQMTENTMLSPSVSLNNPLEVAIDDYYKMAILDDTQLRFFNFSGSGMV